jgi:hypothetical protein
MVLVDVVGIAVLVVKAMVAVDTVANAEEVLLDLLVFVDIVVVVVAVIDVVEADDNIASFAFDI